MSGADRRAEIRLPHNVLQLATDFVPSAPLDDTLIIRAGRPITDAALRSGLQPQPTAAEPLPPLEPTFVLAPEPEPTTDADAAPEPEANQHTEAAKAGAQATPRPERHPQSRHGGLAGALVAAQALQRKMSQSTPVDDTPAVELPQFEETFDADAAPPPEPTYLADQDEQILADDYPAHRQDEQILADDYSAHRRDEQILADDYSSHPQAERTGTGRRRILALAAVAIALAGVVFALRYYPLRDGGSPATSVTIGAIPPSDNTPAPVTSTADGTPSSADALPTNTGPVPSPPPPAPSDEPPAARIEGQQATAAQPAAPTPQPEAVAKPAAEPAPTSRAVVEQPQSKAAAGGTGESVQKPAAVAASTIEPVVPPPVERRALPLAAPQPIHGQAAPAGETAANPAPPSPPNPALVSELERIGVGARALAQRLTILRDLHAAHLALTQGQLTAPPEHNASALYKQVLALDPYSAEAKSGLQSVRQALINRALAQLAGGALIDAGSTLQDAEDAGANPELVADLRNEIDYRQRLVDARAGHFETLYPADQLVAISQRPPRVSRHVPAGTEVSVEVRFTVTMRGDVSDVAVVDDAPEYFAQAVRDAVREWRFQPVLYKGRPIPVRTSAHFTFRH